MRFRKACLLVYNLVGIKPVCSPSKVNNLLKISDYHIKQITNDKYVLLEYMYMANIVLHPHYIAHDSPNGKNMLVPLLASYLSDGPHLTKSVNLHVCPSGYFSQHKQSHSHWCNYCVTTHSSAYQRLCQD